MVVHFNRLKLCNPNMRIFQQQNNQSTDSANNPSATDTGIGSNIEIIDTTEAPPVPNTRRCSCRISRPPSRNADYIRY